MKKLSRCCYGHLKWDLSPTSSSSIQLSATGRPVVWLSDLMWQDVQHQRYYFWWQQHHLPQLATLVPYLINIWLWRHMSTVFAAFIMAQALVIFRLDYCNSLLSGLPSILIKRLQRVQNAAARVIPKADKRDNVSPILFKLHWLLVEFRIKYNILLLTYRALHDFAPTSGTVWKARSVCKNTWPLLEGR